MQFSGDSVYYYAQLCTTGIVAGGYIHVAERFL